MIPTALLTVCLSAGEPALPANWHGTWAGTLTVNALNPKTQTVPVTLEIAPDKDGPGFVWKTTYGDARKTVKDYRLIPGKTPGTFTLDEKNGIVLEERLAGNVLTSTFEVGGTLLVSRYELTADAIKLEILSFGKATETGGKDGVPVVKNLPLVGVQTAGLKKK